MGDFKRISYEISPINYDLKFISNFDSFKFDGTLSLECDVKKSTNMLTLNVKELQVSEVTCNNVKGSAVIDEEREIVTITFDSPLPEGKQLVKMAFSGVHNDKMMGFYRSQYALKDGKEVWNLCTQFESTSARMAFPCIDEPDRKATFDISMVVPSNLVALSNMPETSRKKVEKPKGLPDTGADYVEVQFQRSPIMSTYLVAMVLGHFEYLEGKDKDGIPIRVYAPIGKKECGAFALEVAEKCLPFYKACFGVGYALPKLDMVAIPDFSMGAMENWGLVTYREILVLIDPNQSSIEWKIRVARCVAHELAHMWFGNLVTMEWWTHLWLNEGFARLMEFVSNSNNYKEFNIWSLFAYEVQSMAFSMDGLRSSHPIEIPVLSPDQIDEIFDPISYSKGASVLNMLKNFIGEEKFFNGLKAYMDKFKYTNTQTEDLWNAIGGSSGEEIGEIMSTWTSQMGYPIVEVSKKGSALTLAQRRYLSDGDEERGDKTFWAIPLKIYKLDESLMEKIIMSKDGKDVSITIPENEPFRINPNRSSFVRIKYDKDLRQMLAKNIKEGKLNEIDRLAYIDDLWQLSFTGHHNIKEAFDVSMELFRGEESYFVWQTLFSNILHLNTILEEYVHDKSDEVKANIMKGLNHFVELLARPIFDRLGWESRPEESNNDKVLRSLVIGALGLSGDQAIIKEAKKRFDKHVDAFLECASNDQAISKDLIDPDLRCSIYKIVMYYFGATEFDNFIKLFAVTKMNDEKVRFSYAFSKCQDQIIRQRIINFTLSDSVRKQDRSLILVNITLSGSQGRRDMWKFVKENIKTLPEDLGNTTLMGRTLNACLNKFASMEMYNEASQFFTENKVSCEMTVKQGLEEIMINVKQLERIGSSAEDICSWVGCQTTQ